MHIQHLTLTATTITATIEHNGTEVEYGFSRDTFERWLCGDNYGIVDMSFDSSEGHVPLRQTIEEYWLLCTEINDTDAKQHVKEYLEAEHATGTAMLLAYQRMFDLITDVQPIEVRVALTQQLIAYTDAKNADSDARFDRVAKIREA